MTKHEHDLTELASWVLSAPTGEARAVAFRADGNEVVTVKKFLNSSVVEATDMTLSTFRKFAGLTKKENG